MHQHIEGFLDLVHDVDALAVRDIDVQGLEEGSVEAAPGLVVRVLVEFVRVGAERDHLRDQVGSSAQFDVDIRRMRGAMKTSGGAQASNNFPNAAEQSWDTWGGRFTTPTISS